MRTVTTLLATLSLAGTAFANQPPPVLAIGAQAPDFKLPGIDGRAWASSDFKDAKALCVIFTCNHCPEAYAALGRTRELYQQYQPKGVAFVAINGNNPAALRPDELGYSPWNDSFEEMKPFAEEGRWTFPYLYDGENQKVTQAYGAQATPHVFVFDKERKLRYHGRMDDAGRSAAQVEKSFLKDALDAVLAGREVATPETRPFGCSTKWIWKKDQVAAEQEAWEKRPVTMENMDAKLAAKLLANPGGNVRLINFWSTTCAPCMAEFPDLVETYRRFQNRRFDLVTISTDPADRADKALRFLEDQHAAISRRTEGVLKKEDRTAINYRFSETNPDQLADAIDPTWNGALPYSVLVSPKGEIVWRHSGRIEPVELRRAILKALDAVE